MRRRQANWKLDPPLRRACKSDVSELCAVENAANSENGTVYACLMKNIEDLDPGCRKELGRAYHMALYIWAPGQILTTACDVDISKWVAGGRGVLCCCCCGR
jgi:Golgi apparatus protein 1